MMIKEVNQAIIKNKQKLYINIFRNMKLYINNFYQIKNLNKLNGDWGLGIGD